MTEKLGVLVMAYGTPKDLDGVEAYYTDIRHGSPPPPELLKELTDRYRAIGGRSPLLEITRTQTKGIEERLPGVRGYLGQKHASPFIPDAMREIATDGIEVLAGLVLAPHYSSMSIGDYERRTVRAAEEAGWNGTLRMIHSWHLEEAYLDMLAARVNEAIESLKRAKREATAVIFTAHSLPAAIVRKGDPYPEQLTETATAVADRAGLDRWQVAWQSAGRTDEAWLGPDILEVLVDVAARGEGGVVICPCGFVSDHLEVLYDIDIEARQLAGDLDIELVRTVSPNTDPAFLDMLAGVAARILKI